MSNGGDAQMKKTLETERATSRRYPLREDEKDGSRSTTRQ